MFREVHQGTANLEILREIVLPVQSEHRLPLHAVFGVRLIGGSHILIRIEKTLVYDCYFTGRIVYGIVAALMELHTSCRNLHTSLRHVVGTQ